MYTCLNSNSKAHVIIHDAIISNEALNNPESAVTIHEMLPLIDITDHLAEIIFFPTELSKLSINDEEIYSFWLLLL